MPAAGRPPCCQLDIQLSVLKVTGGAAQAVQPWRSASVILAFVGHLSQRNINLLDPPLISIFRRHQGGHSVVQSRILRSSHLAQGLHRLLPSRGLEPSSEGLGYHRSGSNARLDNALTGSPTRSNVTRLASLFREPAPTAIPILCKRAVNPA